MNTWKTPWHLLLPVLMVCACAGAGEKPQDAEVKAFFAAAQEANLQGMTCLSPQQYIDLSAYSPYLGVKYPPTDSVDILSGPPSRPYQAFAVLQSEAAGGTSGTLAPRVLAQFTAKAKAIGADALIICLNRDDAARQSPGRPRKVEAVAIKYRLEPSREKKQAPSPNPG